MDEKGRGLFWWWEDVVEQCFHIMVDMSLALCDSLGRLAIFRSME